MEVLRTHARTHARIHARCFLGFCLDFFVGIPGIPRTRARRLATLVSALAREPAVRSPGGRLASLGGRPLRGAFGRWAATPELPCQGT